MHYHTHCIANFNNISVLVLSCRSVLFNKKVHTKENGDVWRIVTETGESGNLDFAGEPSDEGLYWPVYGFVIKT
jgi:hypothetical protein